MHAQLGLPYDVSCVWLSHDLDDTVCMDMLADLRIFASVKARGAFATRSAKGRQGAASRTQWSMEPETGNLRKQPGRCTSVWADDVCP